MITIVGSSVLILATLILVIFGKKFTSVLAFFIITVLSFLSVASTFYFTYDNIIRVLSFIPPVICVAGYGFYCYQFKTLDFTNKIFSLNFLDFNRVKEGGHLIGSCMPYYKGQLRYNGSTIVQSETSLRGGTIMTGSSGSGKTYMIKQFIKQDLSNGKSVAFFNFKGDPLTAQEIKEYVPDGVDIFELSWDDSSFSYDPLKNLDNAGKTEAILNMRKWSLDGKDDHYKTGVQLFLQKSVESFNYKGGNYLKEYYEYLKTLNVQRELYESYNTVMKLLELTLTSKCGVKLFTNGGDEFSFNRDRQYILIVSFSSSTKSLGTAVTSLMLRDLMETGTKKPYDPDLCLYIDEFGSCESPVVAKDILEKGRSCHIQTLLAMQDINQPIINTNEAFVDSMLGTVNTVIIFQGATAFAAEKLGGVVIYEVDNLLMSLKKPIDGRKPTAAFISKYPVFKRGGAEVYRFKPKSDSFINRKLKLGSSNQKHIAEAQEHVVEESFNSAFDNTGINQNTPENIPYDSTGAPTTMADLRRARDQKDDVVGVVDFDNLDDFL